MSTRALARSLGLFFTLAASPVVGAAEPDSDWIIWYGSSEVGFESAWVRSSGAAYTVLATVGAAVVSDGEKLWRLARGVERNPRRAMDCEREALVGPTVDVTTVGIIAVDVRGRARALAAASDLASGVEDATAETTLTGSLGARVSYAFSATATHCGQVGDWGWTSGRAVVDARTGRPADPVVPRAEERRLAARALAEAGERLRDCATEDDLTDAESEGWSVEVRGGELEVTFRAWVPVVANCDHSEHAGIGTPTRGLPTGAGLGRALPLGVAAFLKTLSDGPIGIARAPRGALARFRALPATDWFESGAYPSAPSSDDAGIARLVNLGRKATAEGRYVEAREAFTQALSLGPVSTALSGRGYAALLAGDYASAASDLAAALTSTEDPVVRAAIWFNVAEVHRARGDVAAARRALQRSLGDRPSATVERFLRALSAEP